MDATPISTREARATLPTLLDDVEQHGKRFLVTSYGEPRAALISVEDLRKLVEIEERGARKRPGRSRPAK